VDAAVADRHPVADRGQAGHAGPGQVAQAAGGLGEQLAGAGRDQVAAPVGGDHPAGPVAGVGPGRELAGEVAVPAKQVEVHRPSVGRRDARSHPNYRPLVHPP
jgi:hypothetical protein